jgi:hypothetical protein
VGWMDFPSVARAAESAKHATTRVERCTIRRGPGMNTYSERHR